MYLNSIVAHAEAAVAAGPTATSTPSAIPAPPPGPFPAFPVFEDPLSSTGNNLLMITGLFTAIAGLAVILRVYVRAVMIKTLGPDDYVMTFAMMCSAGILGLLVAEVNLGVGSHISNPKLLANLMDIIHLSFFQAIVIVTGISATKISVGFFLLRLVQGKWYKRILYGWIIFLVIFTLASLGTIIFQCIPVAAAWDMSLAALPTTKCYGNKVFRNIGLFNGSVNIFTDFVFAFLPIPLVIPLQINIRTKIVLICILSLGYFACVASIVKEILLSRFFSNPDPFFDNSFTIWNTMELNIGILAASLPALRPLFSWLFETAKTLNATVHFTRHRGYTRNDEETIKMGSMRSRSDTLSSRGGGGKEEYKVSVTGGGQGGALTSHKPSRRLSLNMIKESSAPRSRLEKSIAEEEALSEDERDITVCLALGGNGTGRIDGPWGRESPAVGGIMRTTEVYVSR